MNLEGSIHEINLINTVVELARERFTGAIRFERESVIKIIYFKDGAILSASTNDRADSIDEILLRAGKVTREHVKQALARRKENETLGDALLGLGFISRKELASARRVQLVGIIRSLLSWDDGSYTVVHDYLPKREEGTAFSAAQVIVELIVTEDDRTRVDAAFGHGDVILHHTERFNEEYRELDLNADADAIVSQIDGSKTALEIAALTAIDAFTVLKLLHALTVLGLVAPEKAQETHEVSFRAASRLEPDAFEESAAAPTIMQPQAAFDYAPIPPRQATEEFTIDPGILDDPVNFETLQAIDDEEPVVAPVRTPAPAARPLTIPMQRRRRTPLVIAALLAVVLGGGGWAAWNFLLKESEAPTVLRTEASETPVQATQTVREPATQTSPTQLSETNAAVDPLVATTLASVPPNVQPATPEASRPVTPAAANAVEQRNVPPVQVKPEAPRATAPTTQAAQKPVQQERAASTDPLRQRYDALAAEHARTHRNTAYTIQFELVCQTDSITRAMQNGGDAVWFIPISYKGRDCYRVFFGVYQSRAAGEKGLADLPQALRSGSKPAIVEVSKVLQ
ncbi:MAG: DUF4388 domain-containing protein [Thermoanaerobaculia bacterium]